MLTMGTVLLYFLMVVTIATLNVNGLRDPTKRDIIFSYLTRRKIGITLMQETHSEFKDEKAWRNQWGGDIMFSHGSTNSKGVAILVAPKTGLQLTNGESDTEGRWVKGDIIWEEQKLYLISIYAPNFLYPRVHFLKILWGNFLSLITLLWQVISTVKPSLTRRIKVLLFCKISSPRMILLTLGTISILKIQGTHFTINILKDPAGLIIFLFRGH